jgi:hypothetical protein
MIPDAANHEAANVIDNQDQANRLLRKLTEVLPLSALATPALLAHLRGRSSAAKISLDCVVTKVFLGSTRLRVVPSDGPTSGNHAAQRNEAAVSPASQWGHGRDRHQR